MADEHAQDAPDGVPFEKGKRRREQVKAAAEAERKAAAEAERKAADKKASKTQDDTQIGPNMTPEEVKKDPSHRAAGGRKANEVGPTTVIPVGPNKKKDGEQGGTVIPGREGGTDIAFDGNGELIGPKSTDATAIGPNQTKTADTTQTEVTDTTQTGTVDPNQTNVTVTEGTIVQPENADEVQVKVEEDDLTDPHAVAEEAAASEDAEEDTPQSELDEGIVGRLFERGTDQVRVRKDIDIMGMDRGKMQEVMQHISDNTDEDGFMMYQRAYAERYIGRIKDMIADPKTDMNVLEDMIDEDAAKNYDDLVLHDKDGFSTLKDSEIQELKDLIGKRRQLEGYGHSDAYGQAMAEIDDIVGKYDIDAASVKRIKDAIRHKEGEPNYKDLVSDKAMQGWGRTLMGYANFGLGTAANTLDVGTKMLGAFRRLTGAFLSADPMSVPSRLLSSSMVGLNAMRDGMEKQGLLLGIRQDANKDIVMETKRGAKYYRDKDKAEKAAQYLMKRYNDAIQEAAGPDGDVTQLSYPQMKAVADIIKEEIGPEVSRIIGAYGQGIAPSMEDRAILDAYDTMMRDFKDPVKDEMRRVRGDIKDVAVRERFMAGEDRMLARADKARGSFLERMQERNRRKALSDERKWDSKEERARARAIRLAEREAERKAKAQRRIDEARARGQAVYDKADSTNDIATIAVLDAFGLEIADKFGRTGRPTRNQMRDARDHFDRIVQGTDPIKDPSAYHNAMRYRDILDDELMTDSERKKREDAEHYREAYDSDKAEGREVNVIIKDTLGMEAEDGFTDHVPKREQVSNAIKRLNEKGMALTDPEEKKRNDESIDILRKHLDGLKAEEGREKEERYERAYQMNLADMETHLVALKDVLGNETEDELVDGVPMGHTVDRAIDKCDAMLVSGRLTDDERTRYTEARDILTEYRQRMRDERKAGKVSDDQAAYDRDVAAGRLDKQYIKDILGKDAEGRMNDDGEPTPYLINDAIKQYAISLQKYTHMTDLTPEDEAKRKELNDKMVYLQEYRDHINEVAGRYTRRAAVPKEKKGGVKEEKLTYSEKTKDEEYEEQLAEREAKKKDPTATEENPAVVTEGNITPDENVVPDEGFNEGEFFTVKDDGSMYIDPEKVYDDKNGKLVELMKHLKATKGKREFRKYQRAILDDMINTVTYNYGRRDEDGSFAVPYADINGMVVRMTKKDAAGHTELDDFLFDDDGRPVITKKQVDRLNSLAKRRRRDEADYDADAERKKKLGDTSVEDKYFKTNDDGTIDVKIDEYLTERDIDDLTDALEDLKEKYKTDLATYGKYQDAVLRAVIGHITRLAGLRRTDASGDFLYSDDELNEMIYELTGHIGAHDTRYDHLRYMLSYSNGARRLSMQMEEALRKDIAEIRAQKTEGHTETPPGTNNTIEPNTNTAEGNKSQETAVNPAVEQPNEEVKKIIEEKDKADTERKAEERKEHINPKLTEGAKVPPKIDDGSDFYSDAELNKLLNEYFEITDEVKADEKKMKIQEYLASRIVKGKNGRLVNGMIPKDVTQLSDDAFEMLMAIRSKGMLPVSFITSGDEKILNRRMEKRMTDPKMAGRATQTEMWNRLVDRFIGDDDSYIKEEQDVAAEEDDAKEIKDGTVITEQPADTADTAAPTGTVTSDDDKDKVPKSTFNPDSPLVKEYTEKYGITPIDDNTTRILSNLIYISKGENREMHEKDVQKRLVGVTDDRFFNEMYDNIIENKGDVFSKKHGLFGRGRTWGGLCAVLYTERMRREGKLSADYLINPTMDYAFYGIDTSDISDPGKPGKKEELNKESFEYVRNIVNVAHTRGLTEVTEDLVKEYDPAEMWVHGANMRYITDLMFQSVNKMMKQWKHDDPETYAAAKEEYEDLKNEKSSKQRNLDSTLYHQTRQQFLNVLSQGYFNNAIQWTWSSLKEYQNVCKGIRKYASDGKMTFHNLMMDMRSIHEGATGGEDIIKNFNLFMRNSLLKYYGIDENLNDYLSRVFRMDYRDFSKEYIIGNKTIPSDAKWLEPYVNNIKNMIKNKDGVIETAQEKRKEEKAQVERRLSGRKVAPETVQKIVEVLPWASPDQRIDDTDDIYSEKNAHIIANRLGLYLIRMGSLIEHKDDIHSDSYDTFKGPIVKELFGEQEGYYGFDPDGYIDRLIDAHKKNGLDGNPDERTFAGVIYDDLIHIGLVNRVFTQETLDSGKANIWMISNAYRDTIRVNYSDIVNSAQSHSRFTPEMLAYFAGNSQNEIVTMISVSRPDNGRVNDLYLRATKGADSKTFEGTMRFVVARVGADHYNIITDYNRAVKKLNEDLDVFREDGYDEGILDDIRDDGIFNIKSRIMFKYFGTYDYVQVFDDLGLFEMDKDSGLGKFFPALYNGNVFGEMRHIDFHGTDHGMITSDLWAKRKDEYRYTSPHYHGAYSSEAGVGRSKITDINSALSNIAEAEGEGAKKKEMEKFEKKFGSTMQMYFDAVTSVWEFHDVATDPGLIGRQIKEWSDIKDYFNGAEKKLKEAELAYEKCGKDKAKKELAKADLDIASSCYERTEIEYQQRWFIRFKRALASMDGHYYELPTDQECIDMLKMMDEYQASARSLGMWNIKRKE